MCYSTNALSSALWRVLVIGGSVGFVCSCAQQVDERPTEKPHFGDTHFLRPETLETGLGFVDLESQAAVRRIYQLDGRVMVLDGTVNSVWFYPERLTGECEFLGTFTDEDLAVVDELPHLRTVYLLCGPTTDAGLQRLSRLSELEKLSLVKAGPEQPGQIVGVGFEYLAGLRRLRTLLCDHQPISDDGLRAIGQLTTLEELTIYGSEITDAGLQNLGALSALRSLTMMDSRISGDGLRHLKASVRLEEIYLRGTQIDDDALLELEDLPNLRRIGLRECNITDEGLDILSGFPALEEVSVSEGRVTNGKVERLRRDHDIVVHVFSEIGSTM